MSIFKIMSIEFFLKNDIILVFFLRLAAKTNIYTVRELFTGFYGVEWSIKYIKLSLSWTNNLFSFGSW